MGNHCKYGMDSGYGTTDAMHEREFSCLASEKGREWQTSLEKVDLAFIVGHIETENCDQWES